MEKFVQITVEPSLCKNRKILFYFPQKFRRNALKFLVVYLLIRVPRLRNSEHKGTLVYEHSGYGTLLIG